MLGRGLWPRPVKAMEACKQGFIVGEEYIDERKNIVLIPGDGIGTEIILCAAKAVCDVAFEKANVKVNWIDKKRAVRLLMHTVCL